MLSFVAGDEGFRVRGDRDRNMQDVEGPRQGIRAEKPGQFLRFPQDGRPIRFDPAQSPGEYIRLQVAFGCDPLRRCYQFSAFERAEGSDDFELMQAIYLHVRELAQDGDGLSGVAFPHIEFNEDAGIGVWPHRPPRSAYNISLAESAGDQSG